MLRLYATQVKKHLTSTVKGEVKFWLQDDDIIFTIYCVNSIVFQYTLQNASNHIHNSMSSELCAKTILKRYNSYIRNLFFK